MSFKPLRGTLSYKTNKLTERFSEIALELEAYIQTTLYMMNILHVRLLQGMYNGVSRRYRGGK